MEDKQVNAQKAGDLEKSHAAPQDWGQKENEQPKKDPFLEDLREKGWHITKIVEFNEEE